MKILDVGCGDKTEVWSTESDGIDMFDYGQEYVFDIEQEEPWPVESNKYDKIICSHILEHIKCGWAFIRILNEIWRVGKPGAIFEGAAPHFPSSPNFYRDPTHIRPINEYTFDAFLEGSQIHFGPGYDVQCCFRKSKIWVNGNRDICWELEIVK